MKLSPPAELLLRSMQTGGSIPDHLILRKQEVLDELIKAGLVEDKGTFIRDYSYVTMFSLTDEGKDFNAVMPGCGPDCNCAGNRARRALEKKP